MQTFKVVLDGIELSEEQTRHIAEAVQRTVITELSAHDAFFTRGEGEGEGGGEAESDVGEISILSILKGTICGNIMGDPPERLQKLLAQEFGG